MLPRPKQSEQGFTLIETIITAAIILAAVWIAQSYFEKRQQQAIYRTAQQNANAMKQQLIKLIQRDLRQVIAPNHLAIPNPQSLRMQRMMLPQSGAQVDPSQTFQLLYESRCVPLPSQIQSELTHVDFSLADPQFAQRSACIRTAKLRCQKGSYPQIRIQAPTGTRIPEYVPNLYPDLAQKAETFRSRAVGAMACFSQAGNQITVNLDVLYLKASAGNAYDIDLVSDSTLAVIGNITGMPVLRGSSP